MADPSPADLKSRLRRDGFARRDGLDRAARVEASSDIADRVLALPELAEAEPVGSYWPMRSEVDPRPIMTALAERGRIVALSQIRHPALSWRQWRPGDMLIHGGFGVREPGPDAAEVFPHVLLVPLCAFDRTGGRLGYGKGHFDRSIAELARRHGLVTIGLAFSVQEIERVPCEPHDMPLDLIATELEVVRPRTRT